MLRLLATQQIQASNNVKYLRDNHIYIPKIYIPNNLKH
jgi:hypothetical protein